MNIVSYKENVKRENPPALENRLIKLLRLCMIILLFTLAGCEKFYEPDLGNAVREDEFFIDQAEYRATAMGLYALQQELVEQLIVLGELRADLLTINSNASSDLREIHNFNVTPGNKYASPRNFYTLIAASNNFIRKIEHFHPEVLDKDAPVSNFDKYYGEAWCMRSWAFFNAARIYGEVPYVPVSLTSINEIEEYVNSPKIIMDSVDIIYAPDGYYNDTIRKEEPVQLEDSYLNLRSLVDTLTRQLNEKVKSVGVNHRINNGDVSWDVTVWNNYAMDVLMGQMYLTIGDYVKAMEHFESILYNYEGDNNIKYGMDDKFQNNNWKNILTGIDPDEHILTLKFAKGDRQQHDLQFLFSNEMSNSYQIKPTPTCIQYWEASWDGFRLIDDPDQDGEIILDPERPGEPGDFYRGYNISYAYSRNGVIMNNAEVKEMLENKRTGDNLRVREAMEDVDTLAFKYLYGKAPFDHDANVIIYRAAGIHLYAAEIYANWYFQSGFTVKPNVIMAEKFLNDGSYQFNPDQLGVRGRVGFDDNDEYITVDNDIIYVRDPITNEVTGTINLQGDLLGKQRYLEEKILEERARELAFEGERFYDLIRVAKRREDNAYLADKVAAKFSGSKADQIRMLLMNEKNWYIPFYLENE
jgi:hypothetical protein